MSILIRVILNVIYGIEGHDSVYSLGDSTLTPTEPALGEDSQQEQPYIVRGLRDQPTLTKAAGQSGSKVQDGEGSWLRVLYDSSNDTLSSGTSY